MDFILISSRKPATAVLFCLHIILLFSCVVATFKMPKNLTFPALIAFGDSILDQGTNNYIPTLVKANFPPYGMNFLGAKATGRFTNAKTPADLIAEKIEIKEYVPAYIDPFIQDQDLITGVSFASGATGLDPLTSTLNAAISMEDQLRMFTNYVRKLHRLVGKTETRNILNNSLFLVASGSDDLLANYFYYPIRRLEYDIPSYSNFLVSKASTFVQELHRLGARRVVILSMPPIGCMPAARTIAGGKTRTCATLYNKAAKNFNHKLSSKLHSLRSRNPPVDVVFANVYDHFRDMIRNPRSYEFEVVGRGCCGTGKVEVSWLCNALSATCSNVSKYLFWDSFHPTEKAYKIIVDHLVERYIDDVLNL